MPTLTLTTDTCGATFNLDQMNAHELVEVLTQISAIMGYHPQSMQRAYQQEAEDIQELVDSMTTIDK